MSADLVPVPVPGAAPLMAMHDDEGNWASLRHMCDTLGIALNAQIEKLNRRSWATVSQRRTVAEDGKVRELTMLHSDSVPMWLATIDENRVKPQARPRLIAYQREAAAALDAYFNGRAVAAPAMNQLDVLRAALDQIEAAQRDAADARAIAQRTDERLAAIEGRHDWLSALAYARINELPTHTRFLQRLGSCASRIAKAHDVEPNRVQHQLYGAVNSYPVWIWELASEGFGS